MALLVKNTQSMDGYSTVYSEESGNDLWRGILRYSDLYFLRNIISLSEDDSIFVSMCIKQAHEYYLSANSASLNTKSLHIYYCFLNLTKALLCLKGMGTTHRYHGLCETKFSENYANSADVLKYQAKENNGVFRKLAEVFGDEIPNGQILTLQDFVNNALEINYDICVYFGGSCNIAPVEVIVHPIASVMVSIPNEWKNEISENSKIADDFALDDITTEKTVYYKRWEEVNHDYETMRSFINKYIDFTVLNHGLAYLNLNSEEKRMQNAVAYFGIAFLLSNIVRYEPIVISKLISGDDSIYSLLSEICNVSLRVFPNLIYNKIINIDTRFSSTNIL